MSQSRDSVDSNSNANSNPNPRNRSRDRSQDRNQGRRGRNGGNGNGNANGGNSGNANGGNSGNANGNGKRGGGRNRKAVASSDTESESVSDDNRARRGRRANDENTTEKIRRVNMCAQIANGMVRKSMLNAEIHPKVDADARIPRARILNNLLSAYDLPKSLSPSTRNPHAAVVHYPAVNPASLAKLSPNDPALAAFATCPNAHLHTTHPCTNCNVHGIQSADASNDAKRSILFEYLHVGALHSSLLSLGHAAAASPHAHHGNFGAGLLAAGANVGGGGGGNIAGGGGGGGTGGGNAGNAGTGYVIMGQGLQGAGMGVAVHSGVQGAVPNRLNNNNIGLAKPSIHTHNHTPHHSHHTHNHNNGTGQGRLLAPANPRI
ncbi:hypothetical protein NHQ30_004476 [Ciborinia camelliae]|nr:hypothetical protein NHQ30_004476 [Ciborinia camelliae]